MSKKVIGVGIVSTFLFTVAVFADTTGTLFLLTDGAYTSWTPKSGTTHYTQVDESSCNGTADYVSTGTTGSRDLYGVTLGGVPNYSTITNISITPCASKNSNGGASSVMNVFYRWSGANSADAGNYSLTGTTPIPLPATSFGGLSLERTSASSLQIGAVYTSGTKGARLSAISAVVTYTLPAPPTSPSNLSSSLGAATSTTQVNLTWSDNSSTEEGFKVEKSTDSVNFSLLKTTQPNVTSASDFVPAGTYYYRVKAFNAGGDSAASNTETVVVP